jgi:hypothetical protein
MQPLTTFAAAAALTAGLVVLTAPATADDSHYYTGTNGIVLSHGFGNPGPPEVVVRNVAGNHLLQNLHLAIEGNTIAVNVVGTFGCSGIVFDNWQKREGYFLRSAAFGIGRTSLLLSKALPESSDINRNSSWSGNLFQMPVAMLGHPQVNVDPVAVVLAAAEQAPSKIDWLRQDHVLSVKIPLRGEAICDSYLRYKVVKNTIIESTDEVSYLTKDVELKVVYKGDPQLYAVNVNAQLGQGQGLPDQLGGGYQPFKITKMNFQPNMPHHVGACPATTKIRVFYQGQGKGEIRIRVNDGGSTIYDSPKIAFDAKNGKQHHDFEIATPKASKFDLNKTVAHDLKVYVRGKADNEQVWPAHFQLMDQATWNHRCTPTLNPALGGAPAVQSKQPAPAVPAIKRAQ